MSKHIKTLTLNMAEFDQIINVLMVDPETRDLAKRMQPLFDYQNYQIMAWNEDDKPF